MQSIFYILKIWFLKLARKMTPKPNMGIKRILVVRLYGLKEGLCCSSYLYSLYKHNRFLEITVLGENKALGLLKHLKEFTCYSLEDLEGKNTLEKIHRFSHDHDFDLIYLSYPFDNKNLLSYLRMSFKCPIVGFQFESPSKLQDHAFFYNGNHEIDENLHALEKVFNCKLDRYPPYIRNPMFFKNDFILDRDLYHIGLHPFNVYDPYEYKVSIDFMRDLLLKIREVQPRIVVHLYGIKKHQEFYDKISDGFDFVQDHCGKLSLEELNFLISKMDFFIGIDSAPLMLANSHNIPHIVLISSQENRPYIPWMSKTFYRAIRTDQNATEMTVNGDDFTFPGITNILNAWAESKELREIVQQKQV